MMKIHAALLIKAPISGTVKTRLAASIGFDEAKAIYVRLVEWQLSQIPFSWEIDLYYSPTNQIEMIQSWIHSITPRKINFFPQPEGDLGLRLIAAMKNSFNHGADRVALMGGDCPDLTTHYLEKAALLSKDSDLTIAPTRDGGYALMILKMPYFLLFENIQWSTSTVFSKTLELISKLNLTTTILEEVEDIDDLESLSRTNSQKWCTP